MEDQKQQVVKSYVRYKKENKVKADMLIPAVMTGSIILLLALIFWQMTLTLVVTGTATVKLHNYRKHQLWLRENGLMVNHWNGKREFV